MAAESVVDVAWGLVRLWRDSEALRQRIVGSLNFRHVLLGEQLEALCRAVDDLPAEPQRWREVRSAGGKVTEERLAEIDAAVVAEAQALDPARLPRPSGALPWRVGHRIPIHLYDSNGHPLGTMLTVIDAARVVRAMNASLVDALIRAAGVEADVEEGRDPVEAVRAARDQAQQDADVVAGLAERARKADEARDALKLQVTEFLQLWDRSEEEDPPDLGPAAAAMRAAAGLSPEETAYDCVDCGTPIVDGICPWCAPKRHGG